jgi:hypothetical protein
MRIDANSERERIKNMKKATPKETKKIIEYLASPAGLSVFEEIADKSDEYRVLLRIPEPGGHFVVKMSAASIRAAVQSITSAARGYDDAFTYLHPGGGKT